MASPPAGTRAAFPLFIPEQQNDSLFTTLQASTTIAMLQTEKMKLLSVGEWVTRKVDG